MKFVLCDICHHRIPKTNKTYIHDDGRIVCFKCKKRFFSFQEPTKITLEDGRYVDSEGIDKAKEFAHHTLSIEALKVLVKELNTEIKLKEIGGEVKSWFERNYKQDK